MRPQRLRPHLVQRCDLVLVAHRRHRVDLITPIRPCFAERCFHDVGLFEREEGAPGANVDYGEGVGD